MRIPIAKDGWIFILPPLVLLGGGAAYLQQSGHTVPAAICGVLAAVNTLFMLYFFRDPVREIPGDPSVVVSGADGKIRCIETIEDEKYLGGKAVRVSVYLSPFNVHINRSPVAGAVRALKYTPGKHLLTRSNASSEHNEHSSIRIQGERVQCLVHQIVGPLVRRVVYWLNEGQELNKGDRIGLMKFGSRLDVYLPADEVEILVADGDKVTAGITPIARLKEKA